jgi:diacylglycerol kinase (ATP)
MRDSPRPRRRFLLIDNPTSGTGSRRLVTGVLAALAARGCIVERAPVGAADAKAVLSRAVREGVFDALIAAGGDGTIRLAAAMLRGTETPLGIVPLGTGNVLAHEVGLPRTPEGLADLLVTGEVRTIEMGTANGEPFLLMVGVGFDGHVIGALNATLKSRLGKFAYGLPVMGALVRPSTRLTVEIEGIVHAADWAIITNARCYGGAFVVSEHAGLERPGLVAVLIEAANRRELVLTLLALARGQLGARRNVRMIDCKAATIRADRPVPVQIDGDAFERTPVEIRSGGGQVRLILPPRLTVQR